MRRGLYTASGDKNTLNLINEYCSHNIVKLSAARFYVACFLEDFQFDGWYEVMLSPNRKQGVVYINPVVIRRVTGPQNDDGILNPNPIAEDPEMRSDDDAMTSSTTTIDDTPCEGVSTSVESSGQVANVDNFVEPSGTAEGLTNDSNDEYNPAYEAPTGDHAVETEETPQEPPNTDPVNTNIIQCLKQITLDFGALVEALEKKLNLKGE